MYVCKVCMHTVCYLGWQIPRMNAIFCFPFAAFCYVNAAMLCCCCCANSNIMRHFSNCVFSGCLGFLQRKIPGVYVEAAVLMCILVTSASQSVLYLIHCAVVTLQTCHFCCMIDFTDLCKLYNVNVYCRVILTACIFAKFAYILCVASGWKKVHHIVLVYASVMVNIALHLPHVCKHWFFTVCL